MYRYVVDRSYGAGLNLVFVHICLHDLHFLVTIALDKEVLMTDDCSREITSKTRDLFLDIGLLQTLDDALVSTFPDWFCRHDNELYEDAMRAFALSMDRDRVEKALGESHPALSRIPSAVGSSRARWYAFQRTSCGGLNYMQKTRSLTTQAACSSMVPAVMLVMFTAQRLSTTALKTSLSSTHICAFGSRRSK